MSWAAASPASVLVVVFETGFKRLPFTAGAAQLQFSSLETSWIVPAGAILV